MSNRRTLDTVMLVVVSIIGLFVIGSLLVQFLLLWTGRIQPNEAQVWRPMFDLVAVLVGGVGGYITGQNVERTGRQGDGRDPQT